MKIFDNGYDFNGMTALERGFYEVLCEDAHYNLIDDDTISEDKKEELMPLYFSPESIDPRAMKMCKCVLGNIRANHLSELIDMSYYTEYNLGGELYLAILYGEADKTALEWADGVGDLWYGTPSISESIDGDWRIFIE